MTHPASLESPEVSPATVAAWAKHLGVPEKRVDPGHVRSRLEMGSLPEESSSVARSRASLPALTIGDTTLTHGELDDAATTAASAFAAIGARPGVSIMLIAETGMPQVIAYLGALRAGSSVVLADPTMTSREMSRMARESGATVIVGSGEGLRVCLEGPSQSVDKVVGLDPDDRQHVDVLLSDLPARPIQFPIIDPNSPAVLAFTSGTTGQPKCAVLSHRNLLASVRGVMWAWRWNPADHLIHALPISHQHGLSGIHATLLAGSRATILPRFEPNTLLQAASERGATVMFGVPTIHQRLIEARSEFGSIFASLRLVTSGSAPLPIQTARRFEELTGRQILERYGTTESGLDVSNPYEGERIPGTIGLPLPGVEIAIVDDDGELQAPGDPGEIVVRGPQVFDGYLGLDAGVFLADWFRTGDDGVTDPDTGYITLVGRRKELIISGGMNVYPREVEDLIRGIPGVTDVAVIGLASERWGEEVVAFVTPATVNVSDLSSKVAGELAPYKRPKRIHPVERIPRSPTGKLDRPSLFQLAVPSGGWTSPSSGI